MMRNALTGNGLIIILIVGLFFQVNGQPTEPITHESGNSKVAFGASLSTAGPGLNLVMGVSKPLSVRVGFEQMAFNVPFSFEENNIDYDADLDFRSGSIFLLADFYFFRSLFITGGAGYNLFKPSISGVAASDWKYGDIYIPAKDVGEFFFEVSPTHRISPYLGLGIGHKLSRKGRVSFSMEAGAFYQGPPKISIDATGLLAPTADEAHQHGRMLENQFDSWRIYPVVKMGLSFLIVR